MSFDCNICLEPINLNKNNCTTSCGHKFCFNCIILSLKYNIICPICRTKLTDKLYNEDDASDEYDNINTDDNGNFIYPIKIESIDELIKTINDMTCGIINKNRGYQWILSILSLLKFDELIDDEVLQLSKYNKQIITKTINIYNRTTKMKNLINKKINTYYKN
jgi:hypothetical protein